MEDLVVGGEVEGVDFLGEDGCAPGHEEVFEEGDAGSEEFEEGVEVAGGDAPAGVEEWSCCRGLVCSWHVVGVVSRSRYRGFSIYTSALSWFCVSFFYED